MSGEERVFRNHLLVAALDPLVSVLSGPDESIDLSEKVLALWENVSPGSGLMAEVPHEEAS